MHPAFSVIFLTTLIGAGQGLFLALYTAETYAVIGVFEKPLRIFYIGGSAIAVLFLIAGLVASFFHLGHPERAWRSATKWRTSWLSREVIVLPLVIGLVMLYGLVNYMAWNLGSFGFASPVPNDLSLIIGALATVAVFALFISTGMIYACIKFLQEWASPLTVINYTLLGGASGFTLATALAATLSPNLTGLYGGWAIIITLLALATRSAALIRNGRIKHRSSVQTAIGVRHTTIRQESQGFLGGSFNTREFFHGVPLWLFRAIKWVFLVLVFVIPPIMLATGMSTQGAGLLYGAFAVQYIGLIAERWFFFAQSNHPQNLYYQLVG